MRSGKVWMLALAAAAATSWLLLGGIHAAAQGQAGSSAGGAQSQSPQGPSAGTQQNQPANTREGGAASALEQEQTKTELEQDRATTDQGQPATTREDEAAATQPQRETAEERQPGPTRESGQLQTDAGEPARFDRPEGSSAATSGRPALGIAIQDDRSGPWITAVFAGSPAANAGLQVGDRITSLNGQRYNSAEELISAIDRMQPGDELNLVIYNRAGTRTVETALASRDEVFAAGQDTAAREDQRFAQQDQGRRTVMRPDVDTVSRLEQMQQELQTLKNEIESLRRDMNQLRGGAETPDQPQAEPFPRPGETP